MRDLLSSCIAGLFIGSVPIALLFAQAGAPSPKAAFTKSTKELSAPAPLPRFEDIAQKAGLTVSHISSPDKKYIVESMSGGVGLIDCDNDGKLDIITVNGSTVQRYRESGGDPMITLYHQDADSTTDMSSSPISQNQPASRAKVGAWVLRLPITITTACRIFT